MISSWMGLLLAVLLACPEGVWSFSGNKGGDCYYGWGSDDWKEREMVSQCVRIIGQAADQIAEPRQWKLHREFWTHIKQVHMHATYEEARKRAADAFDYWWEYGKE